MERKGWTVGSGLRRGCGMLSAWILFLQGLHVFQMNGARALDQSETVLFSAPMNTAKAVERAGNQNLRLPQGTSEFPYTTGAGLPLLFDQPLGLATPPGETNRLFVVEKPGRIVVLAGLAQPTRQVFLDLSDRVFSEQEGGLLGLAFHPHFAENGFFYVTYTFGDFWEVQLRLSRFQVSATDPNRAEPGTEIPFYTLQDGDPWHQGGDLHFGPDGYLYISIGDGGFKFENVQRLDGAMFGGILRIDVDGRPGNLRPNPGPGITSRYWIPADNPFIGATRFNGIPVDPQRVRTEYYVVGLRNPWRISFDPWHGHLYSNDTGSSYREEINLILKGANYGWPFEEGTQALTNQVRGGSKPAQLLPPLAEYGYAGAGAGKGKAITAGFLYRGTNLPALHGAYLFSDFWTGEIGLVRPSASELPRELAGLQKEIEALELKWRTPDATLDKRQSDWEAQWLQADRDWIVLNPFNAVASSGAALERLSDGSLLASGAVPWQDTYTILANIKQTNLVALRLEILPDESLPAQGPGRGSGGNAVLSEIQIHMAPANNWAASEPVQIKAASANYSQADYEIGMALDNNMNTGWAIGPAVGQPHQAVFELHRPSGFASGTVVAVVLQQFFSQGSIGRFRLSLISAPQAPKADDYPLVAPILRTEAGQRTPQQASTLSYYYRSIDPEMRKIQSRIDELRARQAQLLRQKPLAIQWTARELHIASMGLDPRHDDLLLADLWGGTIRPLQIKPGIIDSFPSSLADTGIFSDLASLAPAPGFVPYKVNVEFWSDHARKRRWFSLPDLDAKMNFHPSEPWQLPPGAIWVKHFDLENSANPSSPPRRVETRVLVRHAQGVRGATYRWDPAGANAFLVGEEGLDDEIRRPEEHGERRQRWRYPSRSECLQCHTSSGGYALGFHTAQLNRVMTYGNRTQNQITALDQAGYFQSALPSPSTWPSLSPLHDTTVSREHRIRSYLHANCSHCHAPGAPARTPWDARISTPFQQSGLVNGMPVFGNPGGAARLVSPGSIEQSVLWQRLRILGQYHMPPLGTHAVNSEALAQIEDWIQNDLASHETFVQWQERLFKSATALADKAADPDGDGVPNYAEYLFGSDPFRFSSGLRISLQRQRDRTWLIFPRFPNLCSQVEWTVAPGIPESWQVLEAPGNEPFYPAFGHQAVIVDSSPGGDKRFYRVKVIEP